MRTLFKCLLLTLFLPSCAIFKSRVHQSAQKIKHEVAHSQTFSKSFTGFTLLDPATGKTLADVNGDHYFTPASNTKILTLATCLEILGDSVPGMLYQQTDSNLTFRATGDPTFLHPKFKDWQQIAKNIREAPQLEIVAEYEHYITPFGPGWAWDDAGYSFSAERSALPVFGNSSYIYGVGPDSLALDEGNWHVLNKLDYKERIGNNSYVLSHGYRIIRYSDRDTFSKDFEDFVPIKNVSNLDEESYSITSELLEKGLKRNIYTDSPSTPRSDFKIWYSTPIDTVLRRMMHQSDNFIAEQMLLVCAGVKFDLIQQDTMIKWMLNSTMSSLPQRPRWVDGSGLSRYNLMTPQSIAQVLLKLWKEQPRERLFSLFPAGGVSGTIADRYAGRDNKPYVFAKTGGMSGVQSLSGYVVCKSGKVLIFSFMHNNFVGSSKAWKAEMQRLLEQIHDRF